MLTAPSLNPVQKYKVQIDYGNACKLSVKWTNLEKKRKEKLPPILPNFACFQLFALWCKRSIFPFFCVPLLKMYYLHINTNIEASISESKRKRRKAIIIAIKEEEKNGSLFKVCMIAYEICGFLGFILKMHISKSSFWREKAIKNYSLYLSISLIS